MVNRKSAYIIGATGQDGAILAEQLVKLGMKVFGGIRRKSTQNLWRLKELDILDEIELIDNEVTDASSLFRNLKRIKPDYCFVFAGESFVADSFSKINSTIETNLFGTLNVLEAVKYFSPKTKVFFSSSSEIFSGSKDALICNESTIKTPINPYGISKLSSMQFVSVYRMTDNIFAVNGIFFNHESPLRGRNFVTRKITYNMARLKLDGGQAMKLGNFNSFRDWGDAADYMDAAFNVMQLQKPDDYIFATGEKYSVRDVLQISAEHCGFIPKFILSGNDERCVDEKSGLLLAEVSPKYYRQFDTSPLIGDASFIEGRIKRKLRKNFKSLIQTMVNADIERREKGYIDV